MGAVEWLRANERGYIVLPMASLAGERMVSSLSKLMAIVDSSWSGDRDRMEGLNGWRLLGFLGKGFDNLVGIG